MGALCTCNSKESAQIRAFNEQEIAMIIKIQSMVRVKLARTVTNQLKQSYSQKATMFLDEPI